MSAFIATLGLGRAAKLPPAHHAVAAARLRAPAPPEAPDLRPRMYAAHVLGQLINTAAEGLEQDSRYMKHIGFQRRASQLFELTDSMVGDLFEHFNIAEGDSMNALTATCQAALVSIIKLAVDEKYDDYKVNRAHELLTELAALAGIKAA